MVLIPESQNVGASARDVIVKMPLTAMSPAQALRHAAHLVLAAEHITDELGQQGPEHVFERVLADERIKLRKALAG